MKICPECGSRYSIESKYCERDGVLLIEDASESRVGSDISRDLTTCVCLSRPASSLLKFIWGVLLLVALGFCYYIYVDMVPPIKNTLDDLYAMNCDLLDGKYTSEIEEVRYADGTSKYVRKYYVASRGRKYGGWEDGEYGKKELTKKELWGDIQSRKASIYKNSLDLTWLGILSVAIWSLPFVIVMMLRFFCKSDSKRLAVCARWVSVVWCVIFFLPSVPIGIMFFEDKHFYQFLLLMISLLTCIIPVGLIRNGVKGVANR